MSESADRPFEPTPQRIAKAKRDGNLARSAELGANASFAGAIAGCVAAAPLAGSAAHAAVAAAARAQIPWVPSLAIAACACIPLACAAIAGSLAAVVQNGGLRFVTPSGKLQRLDPLEGLRRMLSRETAAHSLRGALAFGVAGGAMVPAIATAATQALRAASVGGVAAAVWNAAVRVALLACMTGAIFAVAEYAAAHHAWLRRLRMTFDERKREHKEQEGDPQARGRRRALARSLARGSMRKVDEASFVIVNPTHVAVALEYRPPDVAVPRILVRAADEAALRVRDIAARRRIPIVENVPLARALWAQGRAGEAIPHALYVAVAEVVAALMRAGEPSA